MKQAAGKIAQVAALQRVLPQLRHYGIHARVYDAHALRLRAHRKPLREMPKIARLCD